MTPRTITLGGSVLQVVESCSYRWLFDRERRRFRREPRGARLGGFVDTPWQEYHRLDFPDGGDSFVVALDARGTRLMSAPGHGESCACGRPSTR
ncbi:MAG TPA: hypothetical protein VFO65_00135 [Acidimicrobiales bacterium]|nr:hypothetical protein [Acidimicrobiales bacterium]